MFDLYGTSVWGWIVLTVLLVLLISLLLTPLMDGSWAIRINRAGLILQLLAGFSMVPEAIGESRLKSWETTVLRRRSSLKHLWQHMRFEILIADALKDDPTFSNFTELELKLLISGAVVHYAVAGCLWMGVLVLPLSGALLLEISLILFLFLYHVPLSIAGGFWLWLCFSSDKKFSSLIAICAHLCLVGVLPLSLPISAALLLLIWMIIDITLKLTRGPFSFKEIIARVTFPLLTLGAILELLSTFLG